MISTGGHCQVKTNPMPETKYDDHFEWLQLYRSLRLTGKEICI